MAKRRRDEFVVGYSARRNVVYGTKLFRGLFPMTAFQALRNLRKLPCSGGAIYRLVEAPPAEVKAQAAREKRARKGTR